MQRYMLAQPLRLDISASSNNASKWTAAEMVEVKNVFSALDKDNKGTGHNHIAHDYKGHNYIGHTS